MRNQKNGETGQDDAKVNKIENEQKEKKQRKKEEKQREKDEKRRRKNEKRGRKEENISTTEKEAGADGALEKTGSRGAGKKRRKGRRALILFILSAILIGAAAIYLKIEVFTPAEGVKEITFQDKKSAAITGVSVAYELSDMGGKVTITDLDPEEALINTAPGSMGHAVEIEAKRAVPESAYITFTYNPLNLYGANEEALTIGYLDEDLGRMRLLEDCILDTSAHTITVHTDHFSQYTVIDADAWYDVWLQSQYMIRDPKKSSLGYDIQLQLDVSGSMSGEKLDLSKESVCALLDGLADEDSVSISVFSDGTAPVTSPAKLGESGREQLKQAVMEIESSGGTNLTAPIEAALNRRKSLEDKEVQSLLILLTDGQDSVREDLLEEAYEESLRIVAVGLGTDVSQETLQRISNMTGGQYLFAENPQTLADIFGDIKNSFFGVEINTDTDRDGDGLPDIVETTGMRNQFGAIIRTDPALIDTDEDGMSDAQEMGNLMADTNVSEMDLARGLTRYVYFDMISDPTVYNGEAEIVEPNLKADLTVQRKTDGTNTIIVNVDVSNDNHVKRSPSWYVRSSKVFLYYYASNVEVSVECPACFPPECNQSKNIGGLLGGETAEGVFHFEAQHNERSRSSGAEIYQKSVTISEPTIFGGSECQNKHIISVTVKADGCEPIVKKAAVSFEPAEIKIKGDLIVKDHLTIASDCKVICTGNVKVKSGGILEMASGSVLETYGDFVFDSKTDHAPYLSQGEIKVHGDVNLKNGFYATGNNKLTMVEANGHTLNVSGDWLWMKKNQQIATLNLMGGITGVRLKGNIDVSMRITYSESALRAELDLFDEDAKLVVESYLSAIEKKGLAGSGSGGGFLLTPQQAGRTSRQAEDKIQYALVKWLASTKKGKEKVENIMTLIRYMSGLKKTIVDDVSIEPMFAMAGAPEGTTGKATVSIDGNIYGYYFSPDEDNISGAIQAFTEDINSYAYQEIKKQLNHAVSSLAPYGYGKYYNALAELMESAAEGNLAGYFKKLGVDQAKKLAVKAVNAEKYYEFYTKNKQVYEFVKNVKAEKKMPNEIVQEAWELYNLIN